MSAVTPDTSPTQKNEQNLKTPTSGGGEAAQHQNEENKAKPAVVPLPHETPAAVRTRRNVQAELHVGSPSDNMLSPCTSKLFGKKKTISGPTAILRNKQQSSIPFQMDENDD